jgi:hypothetical protein
VSGSPLRRPRLEACVARRVPLTTFIMEAINFPVTNRLMFSM